MMATNKGEASKCVNTIEASSVRNLKRVTDMKSIANNQLTFHNTMFNAVQDKGQIWLTSSELAKALEYSSSKSISTLFSRNSDEFSPAMTQVIEMMTSGNYRKKVRLFSIRGAHLIAMFSTTPVAKEFRKWALDILDNEVSAGNYCEPLQKLYTLNVNSDELTTLAWLYKAANHLREEAEVVSNGLNNLHSPYGSSLLSMATEYKRTFENARKVLSREIGNIPQEELNGINWERVLPNIHIH